MSQIPKLVDEILGLWTILNLALITSEVHDGADGIPVTSPNLTKRTWLALIG